MNRIVNTEEFWDKMSNPRFVRTDLHKGVIHNTIYHVSKAPEEIPEFMKTQTEEIIELLKPRPRHPFWLVIAIVIVLSAMAQRLITAIVRRILD